jgi:hypothetical protein
MMDRSGPRYIPVLKGKQGEYKALKQLDPSVRGMLLPLVELPPPDWDFETEAPSRSLQEHLPRAVRLLAQHWSPAQPILIDPFFADDAMLHPGWHAFDQLREDTSEYGLHLVPVLGLNDDRSYQHAVKRAAHSDRHGICLRLREVDFEDPGQLVIDLMEMLDNLRLSPESVDLVIDLGGSNGASAHQLQVLASAYLMSIPDLEEWRTVAVILSAFPASVSDEVATGSSGHVRREDALAWRRLARQAGLKRIPLFGDYGADHPSYDYLRIDPRLLRMVASIRYTLDDEWLLVRGSQLRRHGFEQYRDLAKDLISRPEWLGADFSYGDRFIEDCATGNAGTGNATTWRMVATNHHLTLVTRRLANLGVP